MTWKVGQAKQHLSEVIRLAEKTPQLIFNRDKPVAAIVSAADYERLEKSRGDTPSIAAAVRALRDAATGDAYELPMEKRTNRPNVMVARVRRARR